MNQPEVGAGPGAWLKVCDPRRGLEKDSWYTDILFCKALWGASARARQGGFMWDIAITKKKSIYICVYVYIYTYINIYTEIYMGLRFPRCHDANGKSSMSFVFDALSEIPQAAGTMKNVYLAKSSSDM